MYLMHSKEEEEVDVFDNVKPPNAHHSLASLSPRTESYSDYQFFNGKEYGGD